MAGNYEKNMYNHLMEVMARLEHVERETGQEISKLNYSSANILDLHFDINTLKTA